MRVDYYETLRILILSTSSANLGQVAASGIGVGNEIISELTKPTVTTLNGGSTTIAPSLSE
jgi:hypothetical protein